MWWLYTASMETTKYLEKAHWESSQMFSLLNKSIHISVCMISYQSNKNAECTVSGKEVSLTLLKKVAMHNMLLICCDTVG